LVESPEIESKITTKGIRILALVILCGSVVAPLLLLNGLNQTTAINTSLLLNAESLFTALIAFGLLGERGARARILVQPLVALWSRPYSPSFMPFWLAISARLPKNHSVYFACTKFLFLIPDWWLVIFRMVLAVFSLVGGGFLLLLQNDS
jgi:drug/metabolite transporter (DMT)-like permease